MVYCCLVGRPARGMIDAQLVRRGKAACALLALQLEGSGRVRGKLPLCIPPSGVSAPITGALKNVSKRVVGAVVCRKARVREDEKISIHSPLPPQEIREASQGQALTNVVASLGGAGPGEDLREKKR